MKFYKVYRDSGDDFSNLIAYYRSQEKAEARVKELSDALDEYEAQYIFYGVSECEFEDDPDECAQ